MLGQFFLREDDGDNGNLNVTTYIEGDKENDTIKDALYLVKGHGYYQPHVTTSMVISSKTPDSK